MIACKHSSIGYDKELFKIEALELQKGHVYALIGPNGSGKSTLLHTIAGLIQPLDGDIFIDGVSQQVLSRKELAQKVAWVDSHFAGIEFMRVREYIALGRLPHVNYFGTLKESDQKKIDGIIETMHLENKAHKFTKELSDGERQLVAIARALAQDTPIILLDEPTAFLDFVNKSKLVSNLKEIAEYQEKCILLSTHDIDTCIDFRLNFILLQPEHGLKTLLHVDNKGIIQSYFTEKN